MTFKITAKGRKLILVPSLEDLPRALAELGVTGMGTGKWSCWGTFKDPTTGDLLPFQLRGDIKTALGFRPLEKFWPPKYRSDYKAVRDKRDRLQRGEAVEAYRPTK